VGGAHSRAVAPKHRLVLETALLLQYHLCISQDAWVSMEMAVEQATAVLVLPTACCSGPAPHPPTTPFPG
jgi:ABC-type antimicrobial peptide transport system ATPase subunit